MMENLIIAGTQNNPTISFYSNGIIEMSGVILCEDYEKFFEPVFLWLDHYLKEPKDVTISNFKMRYFHGVGRKYLYLIIKRLVTLQQNGKKLEINWYYQEDDEDMKDDGEYLSETLKYTISLTIY